MDNDFEALISGQQFKKLYEKLSYKITEEYGLNKIEIEILLFLKNSSLNTAKDIAERRLFSKAYISQAIYQLSASGYLMEEADTHDRRCVHLFLTEKAESVCQELIKLRERMKEIIYRNLSEEERSAMIQIAQKVARNIQEELLGDM